jgi:hypothetical protein
MTLKHIIDIVKSYIKWVIFHKYNKIPKESFDFLDEHWDRKPKEGVKLWLYNKIKKINL